MHLHEDLNVLYILDSNICSSVIQKRTHCCISMATYHYLSCFHGTSYSSKMAELKSILRRDKTRTHHKVT
jgi:hypothetical protein